MTCLLICRGTASTEMFTLSLHDALPISVRGGVDSRCKPCRPCADDDEVVVLPLCGPVAAPRLHHGLDGRADRKSTRLNSSHSSISYAVFCLKKKKQKRASVHELWIELNI